MNIRFIDLKAQYKYIKDRVLDRLDRVLEHGAYIMGPEIMELEQCLARFCGQKHALACSSGTDALVLALLAQGVRPGDAVLTSPYTFFATAESIAFLGAVPVFADIDPKTYNISPEHLSIAVKALKDMDENTYPLPKKGFSSGLGHTTPDRLIPRAIVSVDLFGLPCAYEQVEMIAKQEGLKLIVDAAQSFGALYRGRSTCALGHTACTSFFPAKPLGCYGDGGMCFTDNPETIELLRSFRVHGQGRDRYDNTRLGMNARMDSMQAAVLLAKMEVFQEELDSRDQAAVRYNRLFEQAGSPVVVPVVPGSDRSAWAQYSVLARDKEHRQAIFDSLKAADIPWAVYYPVPLHLQEAFKYLGYKKGDFPVSEAMSERMFSLPMHPYLREAEQQEIVNAVCSA